MIKSTFELQSAAWIWSYIGSAQVPECVLFRKVVRYAAVPKSVVLNVTADTTYILSVNGNFVLRGPAKSQTFRYYDTVDISPYLHIGDNVLIVQVCHYVHDPYQANRYKAGPVALTPKPQGGLLIFGDQDWKTDSTYMCHQMKAYRFIEAPKDYPYLPYAEELDAGNLPDGLDGTGSDEWDFAKEIETNEESTPYGVSGMWRVAPRPIPHPFEKKQLFAGVVRAADDLCDADMILQKHGLLVPAGLDTWIELDAGENITAFPIFEIEGEGGRVEFLYAECYGAYENGVFVKRDRVDHCSLGQQLVGVTDVYITGKGKQRYQPFDYKAFRFLRLRIQTGNAPLRIRQHHNLGDFFYAAF